jgi:Flp pilus assembly pilin Flp
MRRGQTLTEYLLLGILIAIVVIAALTVFGRGLRNRYANTVNRLPFP